MYRSVGLRCGIEYRSLETKLYCIPQDKSKHHTRQKLLLSKQPQQHSLLHRVLYKARTVETTTAEGVKKLPTKRKIEHKRTKKKKKIARASAVVPPNCSFSRRQKILAEVLYSREETTTTHYKYRTIIF